MNHWFRADLHIHTTLSPCGSLEMSPASIIRMAKAKGLDIIGITDHNSTLNCTVTRDLGLDDGITVFMGAEVTSREEIHCLAYFPDTERLEEFQEYLDRHLSTVPNDPSRFGYQVQVDAHDNIIYEEKRLLIAALDRDIHDISSQVKRLNGIFIPAHVDRQRFSLLSQLGFLPMDLEVDGIEVSPRSKPEQFIFRHPGFNGIPMISGSDAHVPDAIGTCCSELLMSSPSFTDFLQILKEKDNSRIKVLN